jgi:tRNA/tmRNA/rRNA uracil-C5-methylase (TrmA/RlmC/RlmD family)
VSVSFHVGETVEVTTEDVAQGGWCVARPAGRPVMFVRHALPGERVVARVTEVTSRFSRAEAIEILQPSPDRVEPPCPNAHPGGCGGCDWQHASLPAQRALKAAVLGQHLRRLAGLEDYVVTVEPLPGDEPAGLAASSDTASPDPEITASNGAPGVGTPGVGAPGSGTPGLGWRTRVQFAVRPDGVAGLRAHRSHEVIDIGDCPLAHPGIRDLGILDYVWEGAAMVEAAIGSPEPAKPTGPAALTDPTGPVAPTDPANPADPDHAHSAIILTQAGRHAPRGRQAPGTVPGGGADARVSSRDRSVEAFPEEAVAAIEAEAVLIRTGHRLTPLRGRPYLTQHAAGRRWRVSAGAFWQVHPAAADTLTNAVLDALEPKPGDTALDLYCGAGLFAGAIAPLVGKDGAVIGIESDDAAARDARDNLRDYPWTGVIHADVARAADEGRLPSARLVVADPPRAGLAREIVDYLTGDSPAERFAYVSCDPATLARDLGLLIAGGWRVDGLRAFDAFPMTHHVECVATLTRLAQGRG